MNDVENKKKIQSAIQDFTSTPLPAAARKFFATLGYASDRTIAVDSVAAFCDQFDKDNRLNQPSAYKDQWKSIHLLFQITDDELSRNAALFKQTEVKSSLLQSYVFFAIELTGADYARGKLASITRQLNRIFPMPVMVLFKMVDKISIAVINRRQHKRDESRDVLGKVTLIQNIELKKPHPGHLDILASFSTHELIARNKPIGNFDQLHAAWEQVFNVELLNERFYEELSNWYFWARRNVTFPADLESDEEKRNSTSVIRLLTRLIFCWFLKEKGLIPEHLFDKDKIAGCLTSLKDDESSYYRAILQNLFFATLNQQMNAKGKTPRQFATDDGFLENKSQYGVKTLYRYKDAFRDAAEALALFEDIPFLNGGLFTCLDPGDEKGKVRYADGFSRNPKKQPIVPNYLFFSKPQTIDLSAEYGEPAKKKETVRGLLHILSNYKFTIAENTPVEQEIALDPELLGKVFENLLASYNPETCTTARKQTGSFYTPRPIVDYMVDESLKAYLCAVMQKKLPGTTAESTRDKLDILFAYTEREHTFSEQEIDVLITAIDACNILDPACGSGAFPMGILHKLVFILSKLDPHNEKWRDRQIAKASEIEDIEARDSAIRAIERDFDENALDYGRKLYLIENCIYGVDIQPIAIQIAKLRFFISLVCDQKANRDKAKNHGIRPLPNLETKFVAADTLTSLMRQGQLSVFANPKVQLFEKELEKIRHRYFSAQTRSQKLSLQEKDAELCRKILVELNQLSLHHFANEEASKKIASWNPYDHYTAADFFEPEWMFGPSLANGFDVVIGNPPYIDSENMTKTNPKLRQVIQASYSMTKGNWDIYIAFYERGFNLLNQDGVLSFITPDKWISKPFGDEMRIKTTGNIFSILEAGRDVFENVNVDAIVSVFTKKTQPFLHIYDYSGADSTFATLKRTIEKTSLKSPYAYDWLFSDFVEVLAKIDSHPQKLSQFGTCENACATSDAYKLQEFIQEEPTPNAQGDELLRIINTGTIGKYVSKWGERSMSYLGNKYVRPVVVKKKFLSAFANSYGTKSVKPKLILKGLNLLDACLDADGNTIPGKTTLMIPSSDPEALLLLLAIINSSVPFFYLKEKYPASSYNQGTTFTKQMINDLPIPKIDASQRAKLVSVVNSILSAKRTDPLADTTESEQQIDKLVYDLYGLTPVEIAIIDKATRKKLATETLSAPVVMVT